MGWLRKKKDKVAAPEGAKETAPVLDPAIRPVGVQTKTSLYDNTDIWRLLAKCEHPAERMVRVGPYQLRAGAANDISRRALAEVDIVVALTNHFPWAMSYWGTHEMMVAPLQDFGGVPRNWEHFLDRVISQLEAGKRFLVYCTGGHGRTGTILASLIALLESPEETPDPVEAVRLRHCKHAVETYAQAKAIFDLRGESVPAWYKPKKPLAVIKSPAEVALKAEGPQARLGLDFLSGKGLLDIGDE